MWLDVLSRTWMFFSCRNSSATLPPMRKLKLPAVVPYDTTPIMLPLSSRPGPPESPEPTVVDVPSRGTPWSDLDLALMVPEVTVGVLVELPLPLSAIDGYPS